MVDPLNPPRKLVVTLTEPIYHQFQRRLQFCQFFGDAGGRRSSLVDGKQVLVEVDAVKGVEIGGRTRPLEGGWDFSTDSYVHFGML